jgi:mannose-6-phosphate isomerase-like protein (cupin superfamily)
MSSTRTSKNSTTRRAFFQEVTAGTAGIAVAGALAQLGAPNLVAAQQAKTPAPKGSATASQFFKNPPPWPKGTTGNKYDHLFCTRIKENSIIPEVVPGPQAYFRGDSVLPGAGINMGWQMLTKPYKMELESHHHDVDEYLIFLGATLPDLVGSFDAEIELFLGKEYEKHTITQATVLYIPRGLEHNPLDFKRVSKPLMFSALHMAPYFNGVYQTMGYREFKGAPGV